jgi:putative membrane protein insertion efficiency factor
MTTLQLAVVRLISAYKNVVSPWLPPACRFFPTCSEYAAEAVRELGLVRGSLRALCRLFRCHPFHRGGFDPLS